MKRLTYFVLKQLPIFFNIFVSLIDKSDCDFSDVDKKIYNQFYLNVQKFRSIEYCGS